MKVSRLLCLLLPMQDGQLQLAACLNWQNILRNGISQNINKCVEGQIRLHLALTS